MKLRYIFSHPLCFLLPQLDLELVVDDLLLREVGLQPLRLRVRLLLLLVQQQLFLVKLRTMLCQDDVTAHLSHKSRFQIPDLITAALEAKMSIPKGPLNYDK